MTTSKEFEKFADKSCGTGKQTGIGIFNEVIESKGNGLLNIGGTAALAPGASITISLLGGYDPKNGTSFTIMDYGSEKGTFSISDPYFDKGTQEWVISSYDMMAVAVTMWC